MHALKRRLAEYYLTLRLSAAAAMPIVEPAEIQFPAPIVRQAPGDLRDGWDVREIVQRDGVDFIVTRALADSTNWSISLN